MYKTTINLSGVDQARSFVKITNSYPEDSIILKSEEYTVDAHSIIGILSLGLNRSIELEADGADLEKLIADLQPYTV